MIARMNAAVRTAQRRRPPVLTPADVGWRTVEALARWGLATIDYECEQIRWWRQATLTPAARALRGRDLDPITGPDLGGGGQPRKR